MTHIMENRKECGHADKKKIYKYTKTQNNRHFTIYYQYIFQFLVKYDFLLLRGKTEACTYILYKNSTNSYLLYKIGALRGSN